MNVKERIKQLEVYKTQYRKPEHIHHGHGRVNLIPPRNHENAEQLYHRKRKKQKL